MSTHLLIDRLVRQRPSISLEALAPLALLDRVDSKFVLHQEQLHQVLAETLEDYAVLQIEGVRFNRYLTTYFDTPDFAMYFAHHNGKRSRFKLRCRTYLDSGVAFVELKMKTNRERTIKHRLAVPAHVASLAALPLDWLPPVFPYRIDELQGVVWNRFFRVTLASRQHRERITIDTAIIFGSGAQSFTYEGLCIVEVKQPKFSLVHSPFARQLHRLHLQPQSISKFCLAAAYFYPGCKTNRFKPLLLHLTRTFPLRGGRERAA